MRTLILVMVLTVAVFAQSGGPDSLAAARELYASADYRGALDMLDRLTATEPTIPDRPSIDLYRAFCFVALGRTREADEAIAAMIARDPLFRPADAEIPPRLRPMISEKRKALLPAIIQSRYEQAKGSFDRSDFKTAVEGFTEVLMAISDSEIAGQAGRPPLADLRVLAVGFKDLAMRAMAPQAAPAPAPVTLRQELPRFQRPVNVERTGVLFIVIDETGAVESAIITEPLDRAYDRMVLDSAKSWRYQPATRNGVAVKYRKRIQLTLPRQTS